jgi:hypothetical protein
MLDPSQVSGEASGQGLMGGGKDNVTPEHVLMAAATMHDMGRLVESPSGKLGGAAGGGMKMPHVTRGSGTGRKGGVKSRATGGPVEEGEPYLVGEEGPEVIVPKEKGTVVAMEDTKDPFNPLGGRMRPGEGGTSRGKNITAEDAAYRVGVADASDKKGILGTREAVGATILDKGTPEVQAAYRRGIEEGLKKRVK